MKITADTNVLLRAILADDEAQAKLAVDALEQADVVAISLQSLCEFAWTLERRYQTPRADIAAAINQLLGMRNVAVDRPAVEAGLAMLAAGSDFADGIIAHEGQWLGGDTFLSFDLKAVKRLKAMDRSARLLQ